MMRHSILPATPELAERVFDNLREDSRVEMIGLSKDLLVKRVFEKSRSFVGLAEEVPACVYGIREGSIVDPAELWLASTPLVDRFALRFLRESKIFVAWAVREYGVVGGVVQVGNVKSQKWLRWLGFDLSEAKEHPLLGTVYPFERRLF